MSPLVAQVLLGRDAPFAPSNDTGVVAGGIREATLYEERWGHLWRDHPDVYRSWVPLMGATDHNLTTAALLEAPGRKTIGAVKRAERMRSRGDKARHPPTPNGQYQGVRPNRSYPRQSLRPDPRWRPSKGKKRQKQKLRSEQPA